MGRSLQVLMLAGCVLVAPGCGCEADGCNNAADCLAGEVCGLVSGQCGDSFACTLDQGCGAGAVCDPTLNLCVPNVIGGPCDSDQRCLSGLSCLSGVCEINPDAGIAPPIVGLVSLEVLPAATTLMVDVAGPAATQAYTATGTFDDGSTEDVTLLVSWGIENTALGVISAGGFFTTSNAAGGSTNVVASAGGISDSADLTVLLSGSVIDPVDPMVPPNPESFFDPGTPRMSDPTESPWVVYPTHETKFPLNIFRILFQWNSGMTNDLFRVSFTSPVVDISIYTTSDRWQPDATMWAWLAVSNAGAGVDVTVEGVSTLDPTTVWVSDTITILFATSDVEGAIYYWSTGTGSVMKGRLSDPVPVQFYGIPPDNTCVACHTVARNGTRAAVGYGGEHLEVFDVPSRNVTIPSGTWDMAWSTFNPDASLVLIARDGELTLLDSGSGMTVGPDMGVVPFNVPGLFPTHPDWAPDGASVVVAASPDNKDRNLNESSIYVIPYSAGVWGTPWPLVASSGADDNNYYPSYSPDSMWVAYVSSVDGSDNEPTSHLMLADSTGMAAPIELTRLNEEVNNTIGVDLGSTMPTWAPTSNFGTNWLAVSSIRDYGKILVGDETDQLWVAAIELDVAMMGLDPSFPAFWLPFQDYEETNHRAYWAHDPETPCSGTVEFCDGLDNDCDGVVDEECMPCLETDTCNDDLDNDCDGQIDDGCIPIQ